LHTFTTFSVKSLELVTMNPILLLPVKAGFKPALTAHRPRRGLVSYLIASFIGALK
jgi:hypothetical protein